MTVSGPVSRIYLIAILTVVKTVAVGLWLAFAMRSSLLTHGMAVGLIVLIFGFMLKNILTDIAVNGLNLRYPLGPDAVTIMSTSEALVWFFWYLIVSNIDGYVGLTVAGVYLAVFLIPHHGIEDAIVRTDSPFPNLLTGRTVVFSTIEALAATFLIMFVLRIGRVEQTVASILPVGRKMAIIGLGLLGVMLFVEHYMNIQYYRRL